MKPRKSKTKIMYTMPSPLFGKAPESVPEEKKKKAKEEVKLEPEKVQSKQDALAQKTEEIKTPSERLQGLSRELQNKIKQQEENWDRGSPPILVKVHENYQDAFEDALKQLFDINQESFEIVNKISLVLESQGVDIETNFAWFQQIVGDLSELALLRKIISMSGLQAWQERIMDLEIIRRFGKTLSDDQKQDMSNKAMFSFNQIMKAVKNK